MYTIHMICKSCKTNWNLCILVKNKNINCINEKNETISLWKEESRWVTICPKCGCEHIIEGMSLDLKMELAEIIADLPAKNKPHGEKTNEEIER